jgi:tetratricopeptide (TPR) repeat protein
MSLLGTLFPSLAGPEARLNKARKLITEGAHNDARWILEDLDHPEAAEVLAEAKEGLISANLEEARARYSAGDRAGAEEHLSMALNFGASSEQLRTARSSGRKEAPKPEAPVVSQPEVAEGNDPLWSLPPDDPRLQYAVTVETYPEALRARLIALGADFATAVRHIDNGKPEEAHAAITPFIGQDPVARYERARAALAAGKAAAAASDLLSFGEQVGHQRIGNTHTAVLLAQILVGQGRAEEALSPVEQARAQASTPADVHALDGTMAQLLMLLGRLEEADTLATQLVRTAPRDMSIVRLLAQIREALGQRQQARAILEEGLNRCCSSPGKCGNQPLDLAAVRHLVRMYLEDRMAPDRTQELLSDLRKHVKKPGWDDGFISALLARNQGQPHLGQMVGRLRSNLPDQDPRVERLNTAFGVG